MLFVESGNPVVLEFVNDAVEVINTATLKKSDDTVLSTVSVLDCADGKITEWVAIFDPDHFKTGETYKVEWTGKDINGDPFTFEETGISITETTDFYSGFVNIVRNSIMDDGLSCDYSIRNIIESINYAKERFNSKPPFTNFSVEEIPPNFLLDLAKCNLYRAKASRESLETFNYNELGKSFNINRSPDLRALASDVCTNADQLLTEFKRQLRPRTKGLMSRYGRRSGSTSRSLFIHRVIFRNFTR